MNGYEEEKGRKRKKRKEAESLWLCSWKIDKALAGLSESGVTCRDRQAIGYKTYLP